VGRRKTVSIACQPVSPFILVEGNSRPGTARTCSSTSDSHPPLRSSARASDFVLGPRRSVPLARNPRARLPDERVW
jgi:hypothetical protein